MGNRKMDNGGFKRDVEEGTELELVKNNPTTINGASTRATPSVTSGPSTSCRSDVCHAARRRFQPPDLSESPWHRYKTVSLAVLLILLIIWIVVYSVLSHLNIV